MEKRPKACSVKMQGGTESTWARHSPLILVAHGVEAVQCQGPPSLQSEHSRTARKTCICCDPSLDGALEDSPCPFISASSFNMGEEKGQSS